MSRIAIVGGGIIGLSIAWELIRRGATVTILEQGQLAKQASWAGAGILAPVNADTAIHPIDKLIAYSNRLHLEWSHRLKAATDLDNGYRRCGGVHLARSVGDAAALLGAAREWDELKLSYQPLSVAKLTQLIDCLSSNAAESEIKQAYLLRDEAQFCNPVHNRALVAAIGSVPDNLNQIIEDVREMVIDFRSHKVNSIRAGGLRIEADHFCFAAGPWTDAVLSPLGIRLPMVPVRGQMLMYKLDDVPFDPIVNEGSRYIVPRVDGHVLVGSTIEEVGFDTRTTPLEITKLKRFAASLVPQLDDRALVRTWAGLRPASYDGFPYIGRLPGFYNASIASGHFRNGLQLSTGTAVVIADLIEGKKPSFDLAPFDPARASNQKSTEIKNGSPSRGRKV